MKMGLEGRQALITGASAGIGLETARRLAEEGCNLVLVARDQENLAARAKDIAAEFGVNVRIHAADLAEADAAAAVAREFPGIDILVNSAGAVPGGWIHEVDPDAWKKGWELKVFGYVRMMREYYAVMKGRRSGVICNIIGASGVAVDPAYIAGVGANASVDAMTRALGTSGPRDGVRVLGVSPGPVLTERLRGILRAPAQEKYGDPDKWPDLLSRLPFGRAAEPREVADCVVFLVSDRASYLSGIVLPVDGGMSERTDWWGHNYWDA